MLMTSLVTQFCDIDNVMTSPVTQFYDADDITLCSADYVILRRDLLTRVTSSFQTFLTLSLSDMASRVQLSGPREAEKYVLHMVRDHVTSSRDFHTR